MEALLVALIGLVAGSFINTVIHRIPMSISVVTPGSKCPHCGASIRFYDNIPLVSFLLLGGRCRRCRVRISPRYPVVEAVTSLLFVAAWLRFGFTWREIPALGFIGAVIALSFIDLEHRLLPDVITLPAFVLGCLSAGLGWRLEEPAAPRIASELAIVVTAALIAVAGAILWLVDWADLQVVSRRLEDDAVELSEAPLHPSAMRVTVYLSVLSALVYLGWALRVPAASPFDPRSADLARVESAYLGAAVGGGSLWLVRLLYALVRRLEGTGFGDVKMMFFVGAFLGWRLAIVTLFVGAILALPPALIALIRTGNRLSTIPFGIFLGAGALVSLFVGDRLLDWYVTAWMH